MKARSFLLALLVLLAACLPEPRDEHSMTPLMRAAAAGDVAVVRALLESGADPNTRVEPHSEMKQFIAFISWMQELPERRSGWTPLMFAVDGGHIEVARALVAGGAELNVDAHGMSPLALAVFAGRAELADLLVAHGARPESTSAFHGSALTIPASRGDTEVVRLLLRAGADPNHLDRGGQTPLMHAAAAGSTATIRMLLDAGADPTLEEPGSGRTALRFALERGDSASIHLLSNLPGAADALLNHALFESVRAKNVDAAFEQIRAGADVNARNERGRSVLAEAAGEFPEKDILALVDAGASIRPDEGGALMYLAVVRGMETLYTRLRQAGVEARSDYLEDAAQTGQLEMVKRLIADGADLHQYNEQALQEAARRGHLHVVRYLHEQGASFTTESRGSMTAFDHAVETGRVDVVRYFLERKADPNRRRTGTPVLISAVGTGRPELIELLLKHGADPAATDGSGRTALDHARRTRSDKIVSLLER